MEHFSAVVKQIYGTFYCDFRAVLFKFGTFIAYGINE